MTRVKRGTLRTKKRRRVLKHTRGFRWRRKNVYKLAIDAMRHALAGSYVGRKQKKRTRRGLWQIKINAAARKHGMSYSTFMHALKKGGVELDRKILADVAENHPDVFKKIVDSVKK